MAFKIMRKKKWAKKRRHKQHKLVPNKRKLKKQHVETTMRKYSLNKIQKSSDITKTKQFISFVTATLLSMETGIYCNPIIVTFCTKSYAHLLRDRIIEWKHLQILQYVLVISLDDYVYDMCYSHENIHTIKIPLILLSSSPIINKAHLWILRVYVWSELLKKGFDICNVDLDTRWYRNPLPLLNSLASNHDIIAAPGTFFPKVAYQKWNFVLCCGFVYFKSTKNVINWVDKMLWPYVQKYEDDQKALNIALLDNNIRWKKNTPKEQLNSGYILDYNMNVCVLSSRQFPRKKYFHPSTLTETFVAQYVN